MSGYMDLHYLELYNTLLYEILHVVTNLLSYNPILLLPNTFNNIICYLPYELTRKGTITNYSYAALSLCLSINENHRTVTDTFYNYQMIKI